MRLVHEGDVLTVIELKGMSDEATNEHRQGHSVDTVLVISGIVGRLTILVVWREHCHLSATNANKDAGRATARLPSPSSTTAVVVMIVV